MSEMQEEGQGETSEETQGQQNQEDAGTGINPAWTELLDVLPSQLQPIVTPHLQKWDQNYQEGIGKVHSEYEAYKPFKEQGIPPEQIEYGLSILKQLEENPEEVYKAMQEYFSSQEVNPPVAGNEPGNEQGQQPTPEIDITSHPEFQQLARVVEALAAQTVQQTQAQQDAQADAEVAAEIKAATEKHGEFDMGWAYAKIQESDFKLSIDEAAKLYKEFEQGILAKANKPGPKVLGSGGATPSKGVDPSQLDSKGRRALVAEMLAAQKQQQG